MFIDLHKTKKGLGLVVTIVIHIANLPRFFSCLCECQSPVHTFCFNWPTAICAGPACCNFIYITCIWAFVIERWYMYMMTFFLPPIRDSSIKLLDEKMELVSCNTLERYPFSCFCWKWWHDHASIQTMFF